MGHRGRPIAVIEEVDVAVVGAGPAGASVAALLARAGHEVVVLERSPAWRWRAGGVFASPAAHAALARIGLDVATRGRVAIAIPAMRLETPGGSVVRLTYGDDGSLAASAVGYDRSALDRALVALASGSGADVRPGVAVEDGVLGRTSALQLRGPGPHGRTRLRARLVVGADGQRSVVARLAGVARPSLLGRRAALTFHVTDPRTRAPTPDARMVVLDDAYCGLAPVPGGRLNVGIVLAGQRWRAALARDGAAATIEHVLARVSAAPDDPVVWADQPPVDAVAGAAPLGHRVTRRAGEGWLLVGDAAGFLDPFSGEGLHRALVSAELAAAAVDARLRGSARALDAYDREVRRRFLAKDAVSLLVMAFLRRPALFEYAARRLQERASVRETMGLVMGDLVPAARALDPRFLLATLRP
jgi:flavin-dependent dehydrogenase